MKTKNLFLIISFLQFAATGMQAQRIKGSDTVLPIAQQTAEHFMTLVPGARITVTGGGTGVGISALLDETTDIAMASRAIKFSEKMKAKAAGEELEEIPIAYDALAVVVHPSNPVKQLTRRQLEDIFRGKITNWKQVGGDDRKIVVYSRETSSGTYEFFKESVLKNKNYMSSSLSMPATGAIIQSVSQTRGAIGYVGLAYVSPRIKTLSVSYDGRHFATPTLENAVNKSYPIVRPLFYYYNKKNAEKIAPLLQFMLSPAGQGIIKKSGYIPVK
ncbi:PstS family phosphate ABC transporter substrate-binding protein [Bacteroides helcogenes]|uniref:Phosphate-binding protein n=1 Tax=Bacteroides helcogenes (strain ATCC 35417 / DSM 20613 / JCM 6297 / CCUG 15421 / P 36-108) TaxID=693979 RepID=E6SPP3_BACT6|nr:PstS family phosphate ABC transporter substrate-binding protein [Bacteroides helcogenes]ADV43884.1 phosphate ABC transporter substrate-binding protein, PhoT family [Bacteroides helcogenes P 36-108]MDY5237512.1 PstS family phosphate ABC transporter substrate-binding protein [Bacteroides helcogenes]